MFHKLLKLFNKVTNNSKEPVYIFTDGSGKFHTASVVVIDRCDVKYLRYTETENNSALSELAALQMALLAAKMYTSLGRKVQIFSDNRGVVSAYNRAKQGIASGAPIHNRLVDFIREEMYDVDLDCVRVNWCRSHNGLAGNELADWLTRNENIDNIDRFNYFNDVRSFGEFIDGQF
jgi:ribonuclease HI